MPSEINYKKLTEKKKKLDKHRPLDAALVKNLEEWFRIELTYTSNAIEGNTLSRAETALVVEKGLTIGGKSITEHLEATNTATALDFVKEQIKRKPSDLRERDILKIHEIILDRIDKENAGIYRRVPVRISGSAVVLPNPRKVQTLMDEFFSWLENEKKMHAVELAAEAHYRFVTVHPFIDGNGRTGRLLMNMILMMRGYPPAIIRKNDRLAYIKSLEKAQLVNGEGQEKETAKNDYFKLIATAVDRSLNIYLKAIEGKTEEPENEKLLKIGELAKSTKQTVPTIRHWTKEGLLQVAEVTESGYQMYSDEMIKRVKKIQEMKERRFSLNEIKENLV
ncbi:MAG: Fic family protein [Rickettsiales bacterium]|nr:Fic family protein [Rickettsiales bacterium]